MHCIASAILFWISAIINETMDNILQSAYDGSELDILDNTTKGKNDITAIIRSKETVTK